MNIEITKSGIQCDNPSCDYNDADIEVTKDIIDTPCPKCGENLLTEEDYYIYEHFLLNVDFINSLPAHELNELAEILMEGNPELGEVEEELQGAKAVQITFHKELKIKPLTWLK